MNKQKSKKPEKMVPLKQHFRLVAEVRVLGAIVRELYIRSLPKEVAEDDASPGEAAKAFDESFDRMVADMHDQILCGIEDISPALGAELDGRTPEEM